VELLLNDLSIHGQFNSAEGFRSAVGRLMVLRAAARRFGREIYCGHGLSQARVVGNQVLPQVMNQFSHDQRQAFLVWLTKGGPYWESVRRHQGDDWLECRGEIVTDSAVGEAGYCRLVGAARGLVSVCPSDWEETPLCVALVQDDGDRLDSHVPNCWDEGPLLSALREVDPPLTSWSDLEDTARTRFENLLFAANCFEPIQRHPFAAGPAERIMVLLETLDRLSCSFDEDGKRTPEGHRIYHEHFTGEEAWFTDSSASEKNDFKAALTFSDPAEQAESLFCSWHGKVNNPPYRVHFSWPVTAAEPPVVAYVGLKLTRR
jgi:hypothetical protein